MARRAIGRRPMTSESQPMGSATKQPTQLYHPMSAMAWLSRMIELKKTVKVMATPMWKQYGAMSSCSQTCRIMSD